MEKIELLVTRKDVLAKHFMGIIVEIMHNRPFCGLWGDKPDICPWPRTFWGLTLVLGTLYTHTLVFRAMLFL